MGEYTVGMVCGFVIALCTNYLDYSRRVDDCLNQDHKIKTCEVRYVPTEWHEE